MNVRPCEWFQVGGVDSVPGKVVNSFRSRATVQRVYDETSSLYSKLKFNLLSGRGVYDLHGNEDNPNLFSLISPDDCEDIVGIYLQETHGYRLIPSSCKRDTGKTEFVLKTVDGRRANVQVKQGNLALDVDEFKHDQIDTFLGYFRKDLEKGDRVELTYVPGMGTALIQNQEQQGWTLEGKGFAALLWSSYFSPSTCCDGLKKQILAQCSQTGGSPPPAWEQR